MMDLTMKLPGNLPGTQIPGRCPGLTEISPFGANRQNTNTPKGLFPTAPGSLREARVPWVQSPGSAKPACPGIWTEYSQEDLP